MDISSTSLQAAYAYQSYSYQKTNFSFEGSFLEITGNLATASADKTEVSDLAKELAQRAKELDVFSIIFPNRDVRKKAKSLDDVENDFNQDFMNFSDVFGKMAQMMGLGEGESFTMGLNGKGGVDVEGTDASGTSKLQQAFNGNSTMVSRFAVMAARAAITDAAKTADGFKQDYETDPFAAIKDHIDELKERLLGFRVSASNQGKNMEYGFIRDFKFSGEISTITADIAQAAV